MPSVRERAIAKALREHGKLEHARSNVAAVRANNAKTLANATQTVRAQITKRDEAILAAAAAGAGIREIARALGLNAGRVGVIISDAKKAA